MIDKLIIEQLKHDVGEDLAIQLLGIFVEESKKTIADMLVASSVSSIAINAHGLKSSSSSFGAINLAHTCQLIETKAKDEELDIELITLLQLAAKQSDKTFNQLTSIIVSQSI
ncbi:MULTISPECIES: Hpt domain-containing protein [Pseudoalteromonas]|uniref:Hpt domain-containing protein n=1 Tax=Pseudoalteromonas TaxID=53246 RepID=UPI00097898FF|nr:MULTISPECIES: Hpt domain-containing protein [unclassified Pseudoalteromonas]PLT24032.1 Hpt domain-containing protein [Pseudoalteromonas sp. MelDa3]|tara:strand:- start:1806 stop:2144 length:339 start_codon:yes stop_codon:yes gene_type:complete